MVSHDRFIPIHPLDILYSVTELPEPGIARRSLMSTGYMCVSSTVYDTYPRDSALARITTKCQLFRILLQYAPDFGLTRSRRAHNSDPIVPCRTVLPFPPAKYSKSMRKRSSGGQKFPSSLSNHHVTYLGFNKTWNNR
jgi:hypothetical protein